MIQPTLRTRDLLLRPFKPEDAAEVTHLAGDKHVASSTLSIPHPFSENAAKAWIDSHEEYWLNKSALIYAIELLSPEKLIGSVSLTAYSEEAAELEYWIGREYWNNGYCTQAARVIMRAAEEMFGLNRFYAKHFLSNPASGRILEKLGMSREKVLGVKDRDDRVQPAAFYSITSENIK